MAKYVNLNTVTKTQKLENLAATYNMWKEQYEAGNCTEEMFEYITAYVNDEIQKVANA